MSRKEQPLCGHNSYSISPILRNWEMSISKRALGSIFWSPQIECFPVEGTVLPSQWNTKGEMESKKIPGKYNPCLRPLSADSQSAIIALPLIGGRIIESVQAVISVHPASAQPPLLSAGVYHLSVCLHKEIVQLPTVQKGIHVKV